MGQPGTPWAGGPLRPPRCVAAGGKLLADNTTSKFLK